MGIHPVTNLWSEAWRVLCLWCWRWARHDLQRINAAHPDLPLIVLNIRRLQR